MPTERLNRAQIAEILPHRDDMALLDEAALLEDGTAEGIYRVRGDEFFLRGHFPGNPVVPGVILCEIVAQTSCILIQDEMKGKTPYYAGIDKVRFRQMVRPGDTLEISVKLLRNKMNVYVVGGEAKVNGKLSVSGEFTFIIA